VLRTDSLTCTFSPIAYSSVYLKWSECLLDERYEAFKTRREPEDPLSLWHQAELDFFDHEALPLAERLNDSGVFGDFSSEYLDYARMNREEWARRGGNEVIDMVSRVTGVPPVYTNQLQGSPSTDSQTRPPASYNETSDQMMAPRRSPSHAFIDKAGRVVQSISVPYSDALSLPAPLNIPSKNDDHTSVCASISDSIDTWNDHAPTRRMFSDSSLDRPAPPVTSTGSVSSDSTAPPRCPTRSKIAFEIATAVNADGDQQSICSTASNDPPPLPKDLSVPQDLVPSSRFVPPELSPLPIPRSETLEEALVRCASADVKDRPKRPPLGDGDSGSGDGVNPQGTSDKPSSSCNSSDTTVPPSETSVPMDDRTFGACELEDGDDVSTLGDDNTDHRRPQFARRCAEDALDQSSICSASSDSTNSDTVYSV
jgi:hypothetical protein